MSISCRYDSSMPIFAHQRFEKPVERVVCFCSDDFEDALGRVELLAKSYHVLGYLRYEVKDVLLGRAVQSDLPLLFFEAFEEVVPFVPSEDVDDALIDVNSLWGGARYANAFEQVKDELRMGNTYEVNLTQPFQIHASLPDAQLFEALYHRQPTPYAALLENEFESILSFSPELFYSLRDGVIRTKPMKGTCKRGKTPEEDETLKLALASDRKNRAENVMIVDLLRNDLSRIAKTSSVRVTRLFDVETHPSLHQMTSEVLADVRDDVGLLELLKAIFPCGSITGAPKISTMEIIDRLEGEPRGVYCGAIAYLNPQESLVSVPIRILQRRAGELSYLYRVGGAVVWDSKLEDEWQECHTKLAFLGAKADLRLLETIAVRDGKLLHAEGHWARMRASAQTLGFIFPELLCDLEPEQDGMLRVLLSRDGTYELDYRSLSVLDSALRVAVAPESIHSSNAFLYHKTTWRPWYDASAKRCAEQGLFDELFVNERCELTEGGRTNVMVQLDGKLYTPPLSSGLLNGVLRASLLAEGTCSERVLFLNDLLRAEKVYCFNSVRGVCEVELFAR